MLLDASIGKQVKPKETLKIFRDRGDVYRLLSIWRVIRKPIRNCLEAPFRTLDHYDGIFPMVKDSLGNALRIIRPVVVVDEGHKAMSDLAIETLYGFQSVFRAWS